MKITRKILSTLLIVCVSALTFASCGNTVSKAAIVYADLDYKALFEEERSKYEGQKFESPGNVTYFIDEELGDDANNGLTNATAWKTLKKVNSTVFKPGDQILFKAGIRPTGTLAPQGNGTKENPIVISMFGSGGCPIFGAGASKLGAVALYNQEYFSISSIETAGENRGVTIINDNAGTLNGFKVSKTAINNISSDLEGAKEGQESGGLQFIVTNQSSKKSNFNDIVIEESDFAMCSRNGIAFKTPFVNIAKGAKYEQAKEFFPSTNVKITSCHFLENDGNAIKISGVKDLEIKKCQISKSNANVVDQEHAGITVSDCENVMIDGNMIDTTMKSVKGYGICLGENLKAVTIQRNISHDNESGFIKFASSSSLDKTVVRYNISNNDGLLKGGIFCFEGNKNNVSIYNNSIYFKDGNPQLFETAKNALGTVEMFNNIIVNEGTSEAKIPEFIKDVYNNLVVGTPLKSLTQLGQDNVLVGSQAGLKMDGEWGIYIDSLYSVSVFKPTNESVAKNHGIAVENNLDKDLLGNEISSTPSVGAIQ